MGKNPIKVVNLTEQSTEPAEMISNYFNNKNDPKTERYNKFMNIIDDPTLTKEEMVTFIKILVDKVGKVVMGV